MAEPTPAPPGLEEYLSAPAARTPQGGMPMDQGGPPPGLDAFVAPELKSAKYGTTSEQIKTGLESAASTATFGLSKGVERALGVNPEDIRAREEENPGSSFVGSVAGLLAPTGVAGLLEKAGVGTARALGLGRIGSAAVKSAVEGALFQGGNEVGKMLLSDPDQTIGTAAVNMGFAGLIGAPLGVAGEGAKSLWNATIGKKVGSSLEGAAAESVGAPHDISLPGGPDKAMVEEGIASLKPNASTLQESASRLGVELSPGTLSNSPLIQNMEGNLSHRPTIAGVATEKEAATVFKKLEENSKQILRDHTLKSEAQVGREIKEGVHAKLEGNLKPIESEYKALKPELKKIIVSDELKSAAVDPILNHEYAKVDADMGKLAQKLADKFKNIKDVNDLKTVRTFISDDLSKAYRAGGPEARLLQTAKNALTDMRAAAITDAAEKKLVKPDVLERIKAADTAYGTYKQSLKGLGVEAGLGTPNNARALLDRFSKVSDEGLANRFFDINDSGSLQYLKENFPEQFDLARRLKLRDIYEKSLDEAQGKNGKFDIGKFLRQFSDKKMGPEARELLLNGTNAEKLQDIKNIYSAMPGNPNPSGTSYAEAFAKMFTPSGAIQTGTDAVQRALLKAMPYIQDAVVKTGDNEAATLGAMNFLRHTDKPVDAGAFKSMVEFIHQTIKGENLISKGVKGLFEASGTVLPSHLIPDDKKLKKLDDRLKELQVDNSSLLHSDVAGSYMQDHSMAITQTAASGVEYLNSLRPNEEKQSPLDQAPVVSEMAKAEYQNALMIAAQPLVVLNKVKKGNLTGIDMQHLQKLYPGLYSRLNTKMHNELIESVHKNVPIPYKTRLGMSLFLGQPLDSTMKPMSIQAAQMPSAPKVQGRAPSSNVRQKSSMQGLEKISGSYMSPNQARMLHRNR